MQGIYALVDPRTDEIRYIGRSTNVKRRFNEHMEKRETTAVGNWKYKLLTMGLKPILKMIEEIEDRSCLKEREIYWIAHGREQGWDLLNLTDGGDGTLNPSEHHRAAIAEANRKRVWTDEQRKATGVRWKGRTHTPEAIEKCRLAAQKPRGPLSDEHKAKLSAAKTGKPNPNISEALKGRVSPNKGVVYSDEIKQRIAEGTKRAMQNPEVRQKISEAKRGKPSPKRGVPLSDEQKRKISEGKRRYHAQKALLTDQESLSPSSEGRG